MTHTASAPHTRRFGAQSMTAPLHEVLVKRPGEAFGRAHENPAHGFLHPVDLTAAQRQHDAFCTVLAGLGVDRPPARGRDVEPRPRLHVRPALVTDRGLIALRSGKPTRQGEELRSRHGRRTTASPRSGGSRRPGRPTAATPSGCARTSSASAARCARTPPAPRSFEELVGGDARVFDVPYANGPGRVPAPAVGDLAGLRRPGRRVPAAAPRRPVRAAAGAGDRPACRCPRTSSPPGLQRAGGAAGRGRHGRGQPAHPARAARPRLRGAHVRRRPRWASTAAAGRRA